MEQLTKQDASAKRRALLARLLKEEGIDRLPAGPARRAGARVTAPLSFAQERFWFLDQLAPGGSPYTMTLPWLLEGRLDTAALEQAFNVVIQRHEALHTTFPVINGRPWQAIAPKLDFKLEWLDLGSQPEAEREAAAQRLMQDHASRPFDLAHGPLVRAVVFRLAPRRFMLLVTLHHIISDGSSNDILMRELSAAYMACRAGVPVALPDLALQYSDFVHWQREWLTGKTLAQLETYWTRQLARPLPVLELPADRPRPAVRTYAGGSQTLALSPTLAAALTALSQREGATLFMTLLAAFQVLLLRHTGQEDIILLTVTAGRSRPELEGIVGCFLNTLALRTQLSGNPTFREALERARKTVSAAYANESLPFARLVEQLQPERDLSRTPLFQVMFLFTDRKVTPLGDLHTTPLDLAPTAAQFDLTLEVLRSAPAGLSLRLIYNADLFNAETAARMLARFGSLLEEIVADPGRPLWALPLSPPIEHRGRTDQQVKARGYRIELGEIEAVLGQHPGVREAAVITREEMPGEKRLVAYWVSNQEPAPAVSELQNYLQAKLPESMTPATFILLEQLPLTPDGKVDRNALAAPAASASETLASAPPRTPLEERLAQVWLEVLKLERVGIHDNFFELGGDSIFSLRVVTLAKQAGINLTPRQLFQHPTIAELATAAEGAISQIEQGMVTGESPLLPGQDWFFRAAFPDPHWWNMAPLFKVNRSLASPAFWEQAVRYMLHHHDALRARFVQAESGWPPIGSIGGWQQIIAAPEDGAAPFAYFNLADLPTQAQEAKLTASASELQQSLDLIRGPILRVALFDLGERKSCYLLVIVHHLVADEVTLQILVEDLLTAYQQFSRNEPIQLPPKTTSVQEWGERLHAYVRSATFQQQLAGWLALPWEQAALLPVDYPEGREKRTADSVAAIWLSLSPEETSALLTGLPKTYQARLFEALLTALVQSVARWTGQRWIAINTVDSGRTMDIPGAEAVDLSRTVGWLAISNCLLLESQATDDPAAALQSIRTQLLRFPKNGIPVQVANLLAPPQLQSRFPEHTTDLILNYVGQRTGAGARATIKGRMTDMVLKSGAQDVRATAGTELLREAFIPAGEGKNPAGHEIGLLACGAFVQAGRLYVSWRYSKQVHREATVRRVAEDFVETLKALARTC